MYTVSSKIVPDGGLKVLLVKPPNLSDHIQPPLGLGYLATAIRKEHQVALLDCLKAGLQKENFYEVLQDFQPDVVGIQMYTYDLEIVRELLDQCKSYRSDIITMVGGPHPSADPNGTFAHLDPYLDFAFIGEAEFGLSQLLRELASDKIPDLDKVPSLAFKKNGILQCNPTYRHDSLDELGLPAWDLIQPETYPEAQHGAFFKKFPIAPIMVTRGCPYKCTFCMGHRVSGRKVRYRSTQHVIDEIVMLYKDRGIREFHIVDDNFTMDKERAKEILNALKKENLDISWATPNGIRLDRLDRELLQLMKETGLYMISSGIESGSDRILKVIKKGTTVAQIEQNLRMVHEEGIDIAGFFIIGFPDETEEEIKKTIDFSLRLPLTRANFFTFIPFPGTEAYLQLKERGELNEIDWANYLFMKLPYSPPTIPRHRLRSLQRQAFLKFHLRPNIFWSNLKEVRSLSHFKFLSKRFYNWIVAG